MKLFKKISNILGGSFLSPKNEKNFEMKKMKKFVTF